MAAPGQKTGDESEPGIQRVFQPKYETRAFYNKIAKVYDLLAEHSKAPVRQAGLNKLALREGEKVFEIGCGTGHCLVAIAKAVGPEGKAYGVDISEEMLKHTQKLADREKVADCVELNCGDAMHLPFFDGSMDGVSFTLELFDTPEIPQVLAECQRVLRPGGRIVVVGMSKEDAYGAIFQMYEWSHRHFPNFVDCRPIFVRQVVEAAGFPIRDTEKMSMWVPVESASASRLYAPSCRHDNSAGSSREPPRNVGRSSRAGIMGILLSAKDLLATQVPLEHHRGNDQRRGKQIDPTGCLAFSSKRQSPQQ
jgi:ubiquinone/menaquinone biosynthesis C-methylase UbiE